MRIQTFGATALVLVATTGFAHPHLGKSVEASLGGDAKATLSYNTRPANMELAQAVEIGSFASLAKIVLSGDTTIAAGEYTLGVVRKGDADWVVALYPGTVARGEKPDSAKLVELASEFSTGMGSSEHLLVDITPGSGALAGKVAVTAHYGSLFLAGALQ